MRDINIQIQIYNETDEVYKNVLIPSTRHNITFPDGIYTAEEVKQYITDNVINVATSKGWTVFVGETEIITI